MEDGTAIKICAPNTFGTEDNRSPDGSQHFVTTSMLLSFSFGGVIVGVLWMPY